jgi:hypothetical protein
MFTAYATSSTPTTRNQTIHCNPKAPLTPPAPAPAYTSTNTVVRAEQSSAARQEANITPGKKKKKRTYKNPSISVLKIVVIVAIGQGHGGCGLQLLLVAGHLGHVDLGLRGRQGGGLHELDGVVAGDLPGDPHEGLLEVVVHLGGDLVVLQVLLAVEGDLLGLHLAVLYLYLVTAQHNGDVLAYTGQISVKQDDEI